MPAKGKMMTPMKTLIAARKRQNPLSRVLTKWAILDSNQ